MGDLTASLRGNALADALNRARNAEATLAEIREAVDTFITIRGEQAQAGDLAEAVRQILDREPLDRDKSGSGELDMRIGSAVAAEARRDYEAELIRLRAQVMVFTAWLPIARHALLEVAVRAGQESVAKQYRAAYQALGGGEEGAAS